MSNTRKAFVTLATNDSYALGALVWAKSLKELGKTPHEIVIMIPSEKDIVVLSPQMRRLLSENFDHVIVVDLLDSGDTERLNLMERPELGITITKLHCWKLTQYEKAVFMDADCLVVQNIDELFEEQELSAVPDPGWPDCFNSGVFVFKPDLNTFTSLLNFLVKFGSFDGGDQGVLNQYFQDWRTADVRKHLSAVYNCMFQAVYTFVPAMLYFKDRVKVWHFIGKQKPWHQGPSDETSQIWWSVFHRFVMPQLETSRIDVSTIKICENLSAVCCEYVNFNSGFSVINERDRQFAWERNEIDYTGADRFENILSRITSNIAESSISDSSTNQEKESIDTTSINESSSTNKSN